MWLFLPVLLVLIVGLDASRVGLFGDDLHFLDVARRVPLADAIGGRFGLWPWFRPLSREMYFAWVAGVPGHEAAAAHAVSLAVLGVASVLMFRLGRDLVGTGAAVCGVVLFLACRHTVLLTGWASGFQDVSMVACTLGAAYAARRDRVAPAIALGVLAAFAKEPGFATLPLAAYGLWRWHPARRSARTIAAFGGAAVLVALVHVAARATWQAGPHALPPHGATAGPVLLGAIAGFVTVPYAVTVGGATIAVLVAIATWWSGRAAQADAAGAGSADVRFLAVAAVLGLAPAVLATAVPRIPSQPYQVLPAVPWLALVAGRVLVRRVGPWPVALAVLAAVDALGLATTHVDLDRAADWRMQGVDWRDALRLSAIARRFSEDLAARFDPAPESLVVLYEQLPPNTYFQSEDGPATRLALHDPTVRAYGLTSGPWLDDRRSFAVVRFDYSALHLATAPLSHTESVTGGMRALAGGYGSVGKAYALERYDARAHPDWDREYLAAVAELLHDGPAAFLAARPSLGLRDSSGDGPGWIAAGIARGDRELGAAVLGMLRQPTTAAAHAQLAGVLMHRGVVARAALEWRIVAALDSTRWQDRWQLARALDALGGTVEAERELGPVVAAPLDTDTHLAAEALLASVRKRMPAGAQ